MRRNGIKRYLDFIGTCVKEFRSDRSIEFLMYFVFPAKRGDNIGRFLRDTM